MHSFLEETTGFLIDRFQDLSETVLVLPSKRAAAYLKLNLLKQLDKTQFAPRILSIEEFIQHLAGIEIIDSVELLFLSYKAYLECSEIQEKEEFDSFATWAPTLLSDFNEIDRYLVQSEPFFDYMGSIKALDRWNVSETETDSMRSYLDFWQNLNALYNKLKFILLKQGRAYQGLIYRKAAEDIEYYIQSEGLKPHVFIGFNAMNTAEQRIVQELLQAGNTYLYWDADKYFMEDPDHSASHFLRSYLEEWNWTATGKPQGIKNCYSKEKEITFVDAQENIQQVKYTGNLLKGLTAEELEQTAVVLADESLLIPLLNSLPNNVENVNITMGVPLSGTQEVHFFELLFHLHQNKADGFYYRDLLQLLQHSITASLLADPHTIYKEVVDKNYVYCRPETLYKFSAGVDNKVVQLLLAPWEDAQAILKHLKEIIVLLRNSKKVNRVQRAALFKINEVLQKISLNLDKHPYVKTTGGLQRMFSEMIANNSLDLQSDAYEGLQIMGVLETRCLDFETVIMLSVNEGILPSGKLSSSFITHDLKYQFDLPDHYEKDAIYAYHFYRLLHRVEKAYLLYNVEADGLNTGERSRFLWQLEVEHPPKHTLKKEIIGLDSQLAVKTPDKIPKSEVVMNRIREIAEAGFSPSALVNYIRNPMDFYYERVLGIKEVEEVEETLAAKTLGTIVHRAIELLYKPLEGKELTEKDLLVLRAKTSRIVRSIFEEILKGGIIDRGKNMIIMAVAKRYVERLIEMDLKAIEDGNEIRLLSAECSLSCPMSIPEVSFEISLRGQIDRVDEFNGILRIIDYKTGLVNTGDIEIINWPDIVDDHKFSKAFQVLVYATMYGDHGSFEASEAGVISFKNMKAGFIKFATKEKPRGGLKHSVIDNAVLNRFKEQLVRLLIEICDPETPFIEKDV